MRARIMLFGYAASEHSDLQLAAGTGVLEIILSPGLELKGCEQSPWKGAYVSKPPASVMVKEQIQAWNTRVEQVYINDRSLNIYLLRWGGTTCTQSVSVEFSMTATLIFWYLYLIYLHLQSREIVGKSDKMQLYQSWAPISNQECANTSLMHDAEVDIAVSPVQWPKMGMVCVRTVKCAGQVCSCAVHVLESLEIPKILFPGGT